MHLIAGDRVQFNESWWVFASEFCRLDPKMVYTVESVETVGVTQAVTLRGVLPKFVPTAFHKVRDLQ